MSDITDDKEAQFQAWLERVCEIKTPESKKARARVYARELASGFFEGYWNSTFVANSVGNRLTVPSPVFMGHFHSLYLQQRWEYHEPPIEVLHALSFIERIGSDNYKLASSALELVNEVEPYSIFISYGRVQSSAFALLIHTWLNKEGYKAFLDKELNAGAQWRADLKSRIEHCDYMVLILGDGSLPSSNILDEIKWALDAEVRIIPVWHHGYNFNTDKEHLPPDIYAHLDELNALEVAKESPLYYETVIDGVLSRLALGITPD